MTKERPYLAFDFGAESGRAVLGYVRSGVITTQEIHRFINEPLELNGTVRWDVERLWSEVRKTLTQVSDVELAGVGVDCWGVDYALLGERGELLQNPYHYRDVRTVGVMEQVFEKVSREEIYRTTGIQFMRINTLYQLFAENKNNPDLLRRARTLLTLPDLFHYCLSGNAVCEYTNASTTQMTDAVKRAWATSLMERLGLPSHLPANLVEPGSVIGGMRSDILPDGKLSGTPVIAPASHDTGSAVAAISARDGTAFLSSGTWSLVGVELDSPLINSEALRLNFTNEGGVCGTTRFLKNVMGLWMLQGCRNAWAAAGENYQYQDLMDLAARQPAFTSLVDPDDESFLRPASMPAAIDAFCDRTHQPSPSSPGAYVRAALESLALKYRLVIESLEQLLGRRIEQIRIIGGGSKNKLLNQFAADATGKRVLAGPAEATALGNIAMQILATGGAGSLAEVRAMVDRSFTPEIFEPREVDSWERHLSRFNNYCQRASS